MEKLRLIVNKLKNININDKKIILNVAGSFLVKGGALIVSLITMPIYMRFFRNQEVLGIWFTVLSVMSWILSFDLGIGNGLRNKLVDSLNSGDRHQTKVYITSSYFIFLVIVILACIIGMIVIPQVDWNVFFNISENVIYPSTFSFVMNCVFLGIMLQFLLKLIYSILYALQKAALPNFISLITSILQLTFVLICPIFDNQTNMKLISLSYIFCTNIPLIFVTIIIFGSSLKDCIPKPKWFNKKVAINIVKLGGLFFWVQILFMILTATNELMITKIFDASYVVEYNIYNKLFTLIGSLFTLALTPIWSAVTRACVQKDYEWLRNLNKILKKSAFAAVLLELLLIPFLQLIINIWLNGNTIDVNYVYAFVFALFGSVFVYQTILSTFACGLGKLRIQLVWYLLAVILKFILVIILSKLGFGWICVVLTNAIVLIPYCYMQERELNRLIKPTA